MNRKLSILRNIIFLILIVVLVLVFKFLPNHYFLQGQSLYKQQKYLEAAVPLKKAFLLKDKNLDYAYYYVKTLIELPMTYDVQKELFLISEKNNIGVASMIASNAIKSYKSKLLRQYGLNYIQQVPFDTKILRWNDKAFPLKVYVQEHDVPNDYINAIKKAFASWHVASKNLITFNYVNDEKIADICVKFTETVSECKNTDECHYSLAVTLPKISGHTLNKMDIVFLLKDYNNNYFAYDMFYQTALHEFGHALGIMGHSFYSDNIMYLESVDQKNTYSHYHKRGINIQDINTLKLLYSFMPDITNKEFSAKDKIDLIYPPIILGNTEIINNQKIVQAENYIKETPDLPNGYMDLANAYYEMKRYNDAIEQLEIALTKANSSQQKYPILYNLALTYYVNKNYEYALKIALEAQSIEESVELNSFVACLKYYTGNKQEAENELQQIIAQNPDNIDAVMYLVQIYQVGGKNGSARAVLSQLFKRNPEARKDPRIAPFNSLTSFL